MARRLSAILAADVVGFSGMMERDEARTLALLKAARDEVLDPGVAASGGRIFKTTGDGFLVEFGSAVDAVRCAVGIQETMAARGDALSLRIGINLGDVVVEGDDIFGDGVNVAARLEALAPSGGVAISGNVEEQITGKVDIAFADAGERQVKNISRPVRMWQWTPGSAADAGPSPAAAPRGAGAGRNPVVLVLPFAGPAGDAEVEELCQGVADGLTDALARRRGIEVVARGAAAGLDMDRRDMRAVTAATGADYLLTGSLRRSGARLRINAELVECRSGTPIWSNRYDDEWGDLFDLEDRLIQRIATATRTAMNVHDGQRYGDASDDALSNAQRRAKAAENFYKFTAAHYAVAEQLLDEVLADDPDDAMALSMQAFGLLSLGFFDVRGPDPDSVPRILAMAARAVELDRDSDYAYHTRGRVALYLRGDCQTAIADAELALALNPQYPLALQLKGEALIFCGRPEDGIAVIEKTLARDMRDPIDVFRHWLLAIGYLNMDRPDDALAEIDRAVRGAMDMPVFDLARAAILAVLGRRDEARNALAPVLARWPDATVGTIQRLPFQRDEDRNRFNSALREAGLPD